MIGSLSISDWHALAPGLVDREAWQAWASGGPWDEEGEMPAFKRIPPMMRRRMSIISRLSVEVALTLLERHDCDYGIFVSRHGELPRTLKQLEIMVENQALSPTDFSHSVHNAAAGHFTIAGKRNIPVTSIAAGNDGFQQGIFEALAHLHGGNCRNVFLIYFDDHLPEVYAPYVREKSRCYAFGLVVQQGAQWALNTQEARPEGNLEEPDTLRFLNAWLKGERKFIVEGPRRDMEWLCQS